MRIRDIMTHNPVYISPDASMFEANVLMKKQRFSKLPVVDSHNKLVGIITAGDLKRASPSDATTLDIYELGYLLSKVTVEKIMKKNVKTISGDEVVEEAARIMYDTGIGCLPVLQDDVLVGIVTRADLFNAMIDLFGARQKGVRATFLVKNELGQLAKLTQSITDVKANIISVITWQGNDIAHKRITIKAEGITIEQMENIGKSLGAELRNISEI